MDFSAKNHPWPSASNTSNEIARHEPISKTGKRHTSGHRRSVDSNRLPLPSSSTSQWLTAPINSTDLTPLGVPTNNTSPTQGSAVSRARWSTSVPVKSLRSAASVSSFSRKKELAATDGPIEVIMQNPRTNSESTVDSSSDSEKEQTPPTPKLPKPSKKKNRVSKSSPRPKFEQKSSLESPRMETREPSHTRNKERYRAKGRESVTGSTRRSNPVDSIDFSPCPQTESTIAHQHQKPTLPKSPRPSATRSRSSSRHSSGQTGQLNASARNSDFQGEKLVFPVYGASPLQPTSIEESTDTFHVKESKKTRGRSSSRSKMSSDQDTAPFPIDVISSNGITQTPISNTATRVCSSSQSRQQISIATTRERSLSQTRPPSTQSNHSSGHSKTKSSHTRSRSTSRPPLSDASSGSRAHSSRSASLSRMAASPSHASSNRTHQRPPSTFRTRQELLIPKRGRSVSEGDTRSASSFADWNAGGTDLAASGSGGSGSGPLLDSSINKKSGLMEKLFGDQVDSASSIQMTGNIGSEIRPRILLAATVYHNTATNLWITTINTNQRGVAKNPATANKFLKAFSFPTEREARESAIANAPPKMVPFSESPACFSCKGKFAVFRRASHCRNCGVCVCSNCSTTWAAKMIPGTYNLKNESNVKICGSCNSLSSAFKKALLHGDLEEAIALYGTGNVNLRTPFAVPNKVEIMYPIHCAAEGGNLNILRWLIDDHFCPITIHKIKGMSKRGTLSDSMNTSSILTSKGRSVLTIAMENLKVDTMRYLVVERSISIYECKELKSSLSALEAALSTLPYSPSPSRRVEAAVPVMTRWDRSCFDDNSETASSFGEQETNVYTNDESSSRRSRSGDCIICFDRKINCVATPCGHQVCCLECSSNLSACPVCNGKGSFIKIFRP